MLQLGGTTHKVSPENVSLSASFFNSVCSQLFEFSLTVQKTEGCLQMFFYNHHNVCSLLDDLSHSSQFFSSCNQSIQMQADLEAAWRTIASKVLSSLVFDAELTGKTA